MEKVIDSVFDQEETFKVIDDYKGSGKPKNIVISFDGTGQSSLSAIQTQKNKGVVPLNIDAGGLANVCKLHLIAGGNIGNSKNHFEDQIAYYYSGVGTRGTSNEDKLASQIPGLASGHSMNYIAKMACEDLKKIYEEGDKLFVFGFSRGASIARLFVSCLDKIEDKTFDYKVDFLGVYDTVVFSAMYSLGNEIEKLSFGPNKDSKLPDIVQKAVHFLSIDEHRKVFIPTQFNKDERVKEIWVPGAHSDAGGGYYHDGLSDAVLECMQMEAEKAGFKSRVITEETLKNDDSTVVDTEKYDWLDFKSFAKFDKDMKIEPDALEPDIHDSNNSFAMKLINFLFRFQHRNICVMDNDKASDEPILLLDTAVERVKNFKLDVAPSHISPALSSTYASTKYRPEHLKGIPYKLVSSKDMSISDKTYFIEDQVEEW